MKQHSDPCPIALMTNLIGDRWTMLIIRNAFYGATRFSHFEKSLNIAKNVLAERLNNLVTYGIMSKAEDKQYHLTEKGRDLNKVLVAMFQWGSEHIYKNAAPLEMLDKQSKAPIQSIALYAEDGRKLAADDVIITFTKPNNPNTKKETS